MGISPRRFDGWEPTTRYSYDDQGRMVTSQPEPEWDVDDQAVVLAHLANEADRCPGCGGYLSDTMGTDHGYRVTPHTCQKCRAQHVWGETQAKIDEKLAGTVHDPAPGRLLTVEQISIPTE